MTDRYTDIALTVREVNALLHATGRGGVRDNATLRKVLHKFERFNGARLTTDESARVALPVVGGSSSEPVDQFVQFGLLA